MEVSSKLAHVRQKHQVRRPAPSAPAPRPARALTQDIADSEVPNEVFGFAGTGPRRRAGASPRKQAGMQGGGLKESEPAATWNSAEARAKRNTGPNVRFVGASPGRQAGRGGRESGQCGAFH